MNRLEGARADLYLNSLQGNLSPLRPPSLPPCLDTLPIPTSPSVLLQHWLIPIPERDESETFECRRFLLAFTRATIALCKSRARMQAH